MPLITGICKKINSDFEITGDLKNPAWKTANEFVLNDALEKLKPRFKSTVRTLYSNNFLYVGFFCEDDYVWGTHTDRDSAVYAEECVEIFLNPSSSSHQYYEINVSPKNIIFDACILNARSIKNEEDQFVGLAELDFKVVTKTYVEGKLDAPGEAKYWTAEYAIPLKELIGAPNCPPKSGDKWRANFYRIDYPKNGRQEHYAWNPVKVLSFHRPWEFGILEFE